MMEPLAPEDPKRIGPYLLLSRLSGGDIGTVYHAQAPDGALVIVRVIRPDPEFRQLFSREVAAARKVRSPFTAVVVDADDGPEPWLVTAYVPGPSLADVVRDHGPIPAMSLPTLFAGLATGLHAIHEAGLVHQNLRPPNVLLVDDKPIITDFGVPAGRTVQALPEALPEDELVRVHVA